MISASLKENLEYFNTQFDGSMDFVVRKFKITDSDAALLTLDNMVNKQTIAQSILNPIMNGVYLDSDPVEKFNYIRDHSLATVEPVSYTHLFWMTVRLQESARTKN